MDKVKRIYARWTIDAASLEAAKFNSRGEFQSKSNSAYAFLKRNNALDVACAHMTPIPFQNGRQWTKEEAWSAAGDFQSRSEFAEKCPGAFHYLKRNGLLETACLHMTNRLHVFEVRALALKCQTLQEFRSSYPGALKIAIESGLVEQLCGHLERQREWTKDKVMLEAAKHRNRREFKIAAGRAYNHAMVNGYADEACAHMKTTIKWTKEKFLAELQNAGSVSELRKKFGAAVDFAKRTGLLRDIPSDFWKSTRWSKETVLAEAMKYSSIGSFLQASGGAYHHASINGYLHEACAHMLPQKSGYKEDKPATLYYLRIRTAAGLVLYKIGITNRAPKSRVAGMGLQNVTAVDVIRTFPFASGREARMVEKAYHREFRHHAYGGDPVLGNGNTELFTADVLGLCHN